jgi:hypothetical protein
MPDFEFTSPEGKKYTVTGPEGATKEQAWQILQKQISAPKPEGRLARIGHGLMDPIYGAAQMGARMEEPTAFSTEEERQARVGAVDTAVQQREQQIQARRAPEDRGSTDWYRAFGAVPTSVALSAPAAALGPIGGAVVGGAMGAMQQPETSQENIENFGTQKAIEGVVGGAVGLAGGLLGKGAAAVYNQVRNPAKVAFRELERAAQRDGTTIAELQQKLTAAKRLKPDSTIADVGGQNVRGLVERIAQTPGAGVAKVAPRLTARQQAQRLRIDEDLRFLTGTNRSAFKAIESVTAERAAAATPLYTKALAEGDKVIWSNELERLSAIPEIQSAMHTAVSRWQTHAGADGYGAMNPGALVTGGGNLDFLHGKVPVFPNLQFWDYTKKAMDGIVAKSIKEGEKQYARDLIKITAQLRNELDKDAHGIPTYKAARQSWSGASRYLDAIEEGKNISSNNLDAEELRALMAGMTESEKEAYRIGAVSSLRSAMGHDRAKFADYTKYMVSPEMREKIALMMPDPVAAGEWLNKLDMEIGRTELSRQALSGSPTARRMAQQADADSITGDLLLTALTHEPSLHMLARIMKFVTPKVRDTFRSRSDNILIDLLTTAEGAGQIPENIERAGMAPLDLAAGPLAAGRGSRTREALQ